MSFDPETDFETAHPSAEVVEVASKLAREKKDAENLEWVIRWHAAMQRAFKGISHPRSRAHYLREAGRRFG